eukprot:NODE_4012_length_381_cov_6.102410_g3572_i0.p2 GENE.NODE_4012_length_381_cov_6.102410_g3572_i0~~NODE_4012_length_381_cov_6.102410_g3572_i0.p2  ORF type:complete len:58 (-),score=4.38 NODE_4012_length_381_cov_6.102410_g3572_i0:4-177(-)
MLGFKAQSPEERPGPKGGERPSSSATHIQRRVSPGPGRSEGPLLTSGKVETCPCTLR